MAYGGLFFCKNQRAMQGLCHAPCQIVGKHALSAHDTAADGGAIAFASGRLRNAHELAQTLAENGASAPCDTDLAGLILGAYRLWGDRYAEHLHGPIISGIIDRDANLMLISRDRMGELPLFYTYRSGSMAFASHPHILLDSCASSRIVDRDGLGEIFGIGPAKTPGMTPFRDIKTLEPGMLLIADAHGHKLRRYFALEAHEHEHDEVRTIREVRNLVAQSVEDVRALNPAIMLSGGLDSCVLTALMANGRSEPLHTWSVDYVDSAKYFSGNQFHIARDQPFIEEAVTHFGTTHQQIVLDSSTLAEGLDEAMRLRGFPGMGDIDSSLMAFAQVIGQTHRYVLSGECGDEVFGGYPWFMSEEMIWSDGFPWSGSLAFRESILKKQIRDKLRLGRYVCTRYHESICDLPHLASDSLHEAKLRQLHGLCFRWFMPNLQERAVRMCAAQNLSVLTPFCDERLVQYVYNVPWSMKTMRGAEKGLLRMAMQDLLPEALLWRKKSPYPKTHHPEYANLMRIRMQKILNDPSSPILDLVDTETVEHLISTELRAQDTPWFGQLMAGAQLLSYLIQINEWMLTYRVELDLS